MRCLVNLFHLDPPNNGGASRKTREVSRMLAGHAQAGRVDVVFAVGWRFAPHFIGWIGVPDAAVLPCLPENGITPAIKAFNPEVIVSPLFGGAPFDDPKMFGGVPHIVSMPDALALDKPELFSTREARRRGELYVALRHARLVVTLSTHARDRLIHHLNLEPGRVVIIPNGADLAPRDAIPPPPVTGAFVFYPAKGWPHKRHDFLMRIMAEIWRVRPEIRLVLTGGHHSGFAAELAARHHCDARRIADLGYVTDAELCTLYRHAEALLFVSEYEGFGMPLVEAMASGCPVLCAPLTAIPEVAGDGALFIHDDDPRAWADAFLRTLPAIRSSLVERGRIQAQKFSWRSHRDAWEQHLITAGLRLEAGPTTEPAAGVPWKDLAAELRGWSVVFGEQVRHGHALEAEAQDRQIVIASLEREAIEHQARIASLTQQVQGLESALEEGRQNTLLQFARRLVSRFRGRRKRIANWLRRRFASGGG